MTLGIINPARPEVELNFQKRLDQTNFTGNRTIFSRVRANTKLISTSTVRTGKG